MFNHLQYVPVLRWKSSERSALCKLTPDVKKRITPIFELVPLDQEKKSVSMATQAKHIAEYWGWSDLFFIDFRLLNESKAIHDLPIFAKEAKARNLQVGFVTGLNWPAAYQSAVKASVEKSGGELCFRISGYELRQGGFAQTLNNLLELFEKEPTDIHLVIDFQSISEPLPNLAVFLQAVPNLNEWRSFTVISGAFPKDLAAIKKNSQHEQPRNDWAVWKNYASAAKGRIASFGDYTIQHGVFEEHEGKHFNFSASIRYTAAEYWVIMRGEGVKNENGAGFSQFPAQAELLRSRTEFCGPKYSEGDLYMDTMAQQFTKSGQLKNWLEASFNHHLTFVARQIQSFFAGAKSNTPSFESDSSHHSLQA